MSVLASPTSPTTILTGSVRMSRQRRSIFLRKVALKRSAIDGKGGVRMGRGEGKEGGVRRVREGRVVERGEGGEGWEDGWEEREWRVQ